MRMTCELSLARRLSPERGGEGEVGVDEEKAEAHAHEGLKTSPGGPRWRRRWSLSLTRATILAPDAPGHHAAHCGGSRKRRRLEEEKEEEKGKIQERGAGAGAWEEKKTNERNLNTASSRLALPRSRASGHINTIHVEAIASVVQGISTDHIHAEARVQSAIRRQSMDTAGKPYKQILI